MINRKEAVEAIKNEMLSWLEGDSHDYRKVVDAIMDLPTVEAIPIEFIEQYTYRHGLYTCAMEVISAWRAERKEE